MNEIVDVLIIGAGASGAAVAWSLAETKMRILCLEQGDWIKPTDYPSKAVTGRRGVDGEFYNPNRRGRPEDYPINATNSPIKVVNFNGVGGSTIMYTGALPAFASIGLPRPYPGWRGGRLAGRLRDVGAVLCGERSDDGRIRTGRRPCLSAEATADAAAAARGGTRFAHAMNSLGWHWWPSDHNSVATTEYDGRAPCINLGHCMPACAQGAKASTDITYWPHAIRAGVELRTRCRVREVTVDEHGMASGAIYYDADGVEQFQPAEVVIMACNGVGTPRLLLNSVSGRFPNGLANSSGLVGKNLMFHPYAQVYGYVEEPLDSNRGPPLCLWSKEFYETDLTRGFVRGYAFQFGRGIGR